MKKPDFSYQHILRFMDLLEEHYDDYLAWLYKQSDTIVKRIPPFFIMTAQTSTLNVSRRMMRLWTRSRERS